MKAVLLAGGKGTRLRPYTHVLPKPLMPLGDDDPMPIIEVVLRQLGRFGFRDVTIITGYLTELIEAFCGDGRQFGTSVSYRREPTPLGTAGGLTLLERPSEPVLVDQRRHPDHARLRRDVCLPLPAGAAATIASYPREVKIDFGVLLFDDDPHILTGYEEKPEYSFEVSMGVYILDPLAWNYLDAGPAAADAGPPGIDAPPTATISTVTARNATGSISAATTITPRPTKSSRLAAARFWEPPPPRDS